ncbi:hypothetical protein GLOIN_2v1777041 [Rhizophagus clarus]|uniref:Uncharacterized protein n=1 Tax=Rhizophagus clarus TaxID=94130 RepID=A0A8H3L3F0_9GLOM|nr:hypothetical protein GLOIN_2v1777041 [Rhizophagus clarus]
MNTKKKNHHYQKDKKLIDTTASKKVKHNDNKAEGSASYVKDTLSSSSLETIAETESALDIKMTAKVFSVIITNKSNVILEVEEIYRIIKDWICLRMKVVDMMRLVNDYSFANSYILDLSSKSTVAKEFILFSCYTYFNSILDLFFLTMELHSHVF